MPAKAAESKRHVKLGRGGKRDIKIAKWRKDEIGALGRVVARVGWATPWAQNGSERKKDRG
jgi:hypothetical protein